MQFLGTRPLFPCFRSSSPTWGHMQSLGRTFLSLALLAASSALRPGFVTPPAARRPGLAPPRPGRALRRRFSMAMGPLDGLIQAAKYRETCPPQACIEQLLLDQFRKQDFDPTVLHWLHPATMLLIVAPMLVFGASLGWKIRGSGEASASRLDADERKSAGGTHAILMSLALLFSAFGIQGGLGSLLLAREPILESPHSLSGFAFVAVLGVQVVISLPPSCAERLTRCCRCGYHFLHVGHLGRADSRPRWEAKSCCVLRTPS